MGILGAMGMLGTPGTAGLLAGGERGQSRGNGSPPSHVKRVLTYSAHLTHPTHRRVLLDRPDRLRDFRCFYIVFSFLVLIFIFFRIYFHDADNWRMNYRHHDFLHLKLIYAGKRGKNIFALARNIIPAIAGNRAPNKAKQNQPRPARMP